MLEATGASGAEHGSRNREVLVDWGQTHWLEGLLVGDKKMAPTGGSSRTIYSGGAKSLKKSGHPSSLASGSRRFPLLLG